MRVLVDDIAWNVPHGTDITHLPMMDIIELDETRINDQDDFWAVCYETLSNKHNTEIYGLRYQVLEGTIH
jgi:hypothetical protein